MSESQGLAAPEMHKRFAESINHEVWELLEEQTRSREEDERMLYAAYASGYHWMHAGTALHRQRAEWLVSHVLAALGRGEGAWAHARRCMELTEQHPDLMQDFDRAYALEALGRAAALCGWPEEAERYSALAEQAGNAIQNDEDRQIFFGDFRKGRSSV